MGSGTSTPAAPLDYYSHPQVNENALYRSRVKLYKAIKKNDAFCTRHALSYGVDINGNLNPRGFDHYISFHAAAEFNAFNAMESIIEVGKKFKKDLQSMSEIPNAQGQTAAVICIMRDASETFSILVRENLVKTDTRDNKGQSIADLCSQYAPKCLSVLNNSRP